MSWTPKRAGLINPLSVVLLINTTSARISSMKMVELHLDHQLLSPAVEMGELAREQSFLQNREHDRNFFTDSLADKCIALTATRATDGVTGSVGGFRCEDIFEAGMGNIAHST